MPQLLMWKSGGWRFALALTVALSALTAIGPVVLSSSALAQSGTIRDIRVAGNRRVEPETVRSYLKFNVGDPYDPGKVDQSIKSLFATGLFSDVRIDRDGTGVLVTVVENPVINQVAFEGNREVDKATLQNEVQLKPRSVYTRAKVQADVQRILDVYRRQGRLRLRSSRRLSTSTAIGLTSSLRSMKARRPRSRPSISSATGPSPTPSCATSSPPRSRACSISSKERTSTIRTGSLSIGSCCGSIT
jgi:hypothetical protein